MWYPTKKLWDKAVFEIVWSWINIFEWEKKYYSTSSIQLNKVLEPESIITYKKRQSRANMEFEKWTVIFAKMKGTNKVIIIDENLSNNAVFSTWFSWIKWNKKDVFSWYLFYYFSSNYFNKIKDELSSWVTQVAINNSWISQIPIPLPPLPTQKLIVQKLDSSFEKIDKSIELTKKNLENIEELNKSILEENFSWYNNEIIWNLVEKTKNWNPKNIWESFFEYIDISSIDNKNYLLTETKNIKWIEAPSRAKQIVIKNDIIFATTRPNLKNISVIDLDIENLTCSTWFCVLRTIEEKLYYKFLFYYIVTDLFQDKLTPYIRWAQYPAISDKDLKSLKIPLPPLERQKEIVSYLDQVFEKNRVLKEKYEKKLKDLEEMKQSLLKEAFEWRLVEK